MSAPAWFDKDVYLTNKLAQLQADEPNNGWDMLKMLEAFNNAGFNPFTDDGIYAHFVAFGNAEGISPNAYFDEGTYFTNKLAQLQATEPDKGWTSVDQVKEAFADAGLSAWDHYTLFGTAEGVSPSKYFDTNAYMKAKLAQMKADDPAYTMTQLKQAFKDADLNPIEHYILFGKDENLSYTPYPVDTTDPNKKVVELATPSTFYIDGAKETTDVLPSGDYTLIGNAKNLADASYTIVAGAKGDVVLKDDVATLVALNADVKEALGLASKVTVHDTLDNLISANLPSEITAKSVSYLVSDDPKTVKMSNVTVAQATDAQATLAAFLANPYVEFESGNTPTDLEPTIVSVADTVANLSAADLSKIGDANTDYFAKDSISNIENMPASLLSKIDGVQVEDSLSQIATLTDLVGTKENTFTLTDTAKDGSCAFTLESDLNFSQSTIDASSIGDGKTDTTIDFTLSVADGATEGLTLNAGLLTNLLDKVTVNITGSAQDDIITAASVGGTIDGGLGQDTIILAAGNQKEDTVVLGTGISSADKLAGNDDVISNFETGKDDIDFAGDLLGGFDSDDYVTIGTAADAIAGTGQGGKLFVASISMADANSASAIAAVFSNDMDANAKMIYISSSDTASYVWYVEDADGNQDIAGTECHLIATLQGVQSKDLVQGDFA